MRARTSAATLCALVALSLSACRDGSRAAADDPRIRYEGRVLVDGRGRVRFAWPRTVVHVRFRGAGLGATLGETPYEDTMRDTDVVGVEVDGGPMRRLALREGVFEYTLASGLGPGVHRLRLVKLTEAEVGTVRLDGVRALGGATILAHDPRPARRMLAVGDSITAGYGALGRDSRCEYDATLNDASIAWVSRAADALGAELQVIAWSGRGLTRNYDPEVGETLVDVCDRAVPTEPDHGGDGRGYTPDDVVLNVGTNDAARAGFDDALFRDALGRFVARLGRRFPRARFVLAVGPLLHDDVPTAGCRSLTRVRTATAAVVDQLRASGRRATLLELGAAGADECCGCGGHPSDRTHRRMAEALTAALRAP